MIDDSQVVRDANELCCVLPIEPFVADSFNVLRDLGFDSGYRLRAAVNKLKEMGINIASERIAGVLWLAIARESASDAAFSGNRYWKQQYGE